jgi:carboxyl-terminal processing protease
LRGEAGTDVRLGVDRPGQPRPLSVVVTRGEVYRQAVRRSALLANGVGYLDVKIFSDSTEKELSRAIDSLSRIGMRSLVIDLRGNPGGLLTQGVAVSDLFLDPRQTIVRMKGRTPETTRTYGDSIPQRWPALPLVLLVDEGSASAAEIVAGALQDHDRALLVGRTTYGKGSAQAVFQTTAGGGLKLTTARWYTPSGRSIDRTDESQQLRDREEREEFKTDGGRVVFGGGGIAPDVVAGDTSLTRSELALQNALGERVTEFRDALTAYAVSIRGTGRVTSPEFPVTAGMLDGAWQELRRRGFSFERGIYDRASALVSQLLAREVARLEFGSPGESRRVIMDDEVIQRAAAIAGRASRPQDVFAGVDSAKR